MRNQWTKLAGTGPASLLLLTGPANGNREGVASDRSVINWVTHPVQIEVPDKVLILDRAIVNKDGVTGTCEVVGYAFDSREAFRARRC
jgi:hypothetical protein